MSNTIANITIRTHKPLIETLKFEQVTYKTDHSDPIFDNVTFDFPMNENVLVKAVSPEGRTTLMQLLAALIQPTQGKYLLNGLDITQLSFEEFLSYRLKIGYGFDMGGLLHNRTVLENLTLPLLYHKLTTPKEAEERAMFYLKELGAIKYKDQRPAQIPGSLRKLTCLIRALITEPEVLLLDDPSVGITQDIMLKYFDLIAKLRKEGKTHHVYISSFDDKLMSLIEHTEIFIDQGQIFSDFSNGEKKVVNL